MDQNTSERRYTWCSYGLFTSDCPAALVISLHSLFLPHLVESSFDPISTSLHPYLLLSLNGCSVIISLSGFALRWLLRCQQFLTDLLIALGKQRQALINMVFFFIFLSLPVCWECSSVLGLGCCQRGTGSTASVRHSASIAERACAAMHFIIWPPSLFSRSHLPIPPPLLPTAPDQTHSDWGWDPEAQKQGKRLKLLIRRCRTAGYCQDDGNKLRI